MSLNVPPIGTRGLYTLKAPYTTVPNELYTCGAIRYFKDIQNQGIDIYKRYYLAYEIEEWEYIRDLQAGVVLVTLMSDTQAPIYVPSSFITAFPNQGSVPYHHVVLSLSLGPLPEDLNLTFLKDQIAGVVSDVIGVSPQVYENVAASSGSITSEEHDALVAARQNAIVTRDTDYAKVINLQRQNTILTEKIRNLEAIILSL